MVARFNSLTTYCAVVHMTANYTSFSAVHFLDSYPIIHYFQCNKKKKSSCRKLKLLKMSNCHRVHGIAFIFISYVVM